MGNPIYEYAAAEKLEIIGLVEQSSLSVRRTLAQLGGVVRNFVFSKPVVDERSSCVSNCLTTV
jgi:hypothetical protein